MDIRFITLITAAFLLCRCDTVAEIGDVTLQTDHSQYPGEGVFQTPESCVEWATRNATTDHERALAIFNWLLTHQWHLMSPQEWCQPGRVPGRKLDDYEMVVFDANRGRFSYGYGLCGTVHAWNEAYWAAAGYPARRRAFPGHSNSEVLVDGQWRMYDTDMAGIIFNRDGSVAGYDDIISDLTLIDRQHGENPKYPFAWPSDFKTMKSGWEEVARGGNWYSLYHGGYAAQPGIVHLRSGETFTRFAHPDGFGGPDKRRFWHQQKGGPFRTWTFANNGAPHHLADESNSRGRTRYGNAVFEFSPHLTRDSWNEGVVQRSENAVSTSRGLASSDSNTATVVFEHFSPYVICGDPVDDTNPMTGRATDGLVVSGKSTGKVVVSVSPDQGQSWPDEQSVQGDFRLDLTDFVKGRYGWWIKIAVPNDSILQAVSFATTGQMCESIYPRLKPNGTSVTYRSQRRAVVPVLPQLADESVTEDRFEERRLRSDNLDFVGRSANQRFAYRVRGPKPASMTLRIPARTMLQSVSAAARFGLRVPTPHGAAFQLDYSVDDGASWTQFAEVVPPVDNEFSSGWVYGNADLEPRPDAHDTQVRIRMNGGGYGTGLLSVEAYGIRETAIPSGGTLTWGWFDGNKKQEHKTIIPAACETLTTLVPTGAHVRNDFVRIVVE
jgi:hypothetical protein